MGENIKELIEKIQKEGVNVAQEKARKIGEEANFRKDEILNRAQLEADSLIDEAEERINKMEEASSLALKQAARDLFLELKKEVFAMLDNIILSEVRKTLTHEELAKIINSIIHEQVLKNSGDILINLNKDDLCKLEATFLKNLKEDILKGIKLKSKDDISKGFIISYDLGKSHFDFTDKALAEYLGGYVNPRLAEILKQATI